MRIVWLKSDYVIPPDSGGKIRTYNLLRELNRLCELEYVSFKSNRDPNTEPQMAACARRVHTIYQPEEQKSGWRFYSRVLANVPSRLPYIVRKYRHSEFLQYQQQHCRSNGWQESGRIGRDTVVVCDFLEMAENVNWEVPAPKVLFQHNVESIIWQRYCAAESNPLKRAYFCFESRRMARYERAACNRFNLVLTVTEKDRDRLRDELQVTAPLGVIETGVDIEYFQPGDPTATRPGRLLFLGSLDWMPNIDGMKWFTSEVYPLLRQAAPAVSLQIVGRRPDPGIMSLAQRDPTIEVIGNVPDVRPYIAAADLFIVPLRVGGGSRLKIFEAMAMCKPVVSTTVGAEGLPLVDGQHLAIADTPEQLSRSMAALLAQPEAKQRLAQNGYQLVTENYPWSRIAKDFHEKCLQLIQN